MASKGGDEMRKVREQRNLSQREVAEMLGISNNEVSDYENGRKTPGLERAVKIEKVLGVPCEVWV